MIDVADVPNNTILEHLRAIRGELGKLGEWMHTLSVEMTAIRQHLAGVVTIKEQDTAPNSEGRVG